MMNSIEFASYTDLSPSTPHLLARIGSYRKVCQSFGVNRRIMIGLATKNRAELTKALPQLNDQENGLDKTLSIVADYREHIEEMLEFAKMVEARIIVSCHDVFGVSFDKTCPK